MLLVQYVAKRNLLQNWSPVHVAINLPVKVVVRTADKAIPMGMYASAV